ncbi:hypothetical protein [Curtobacterium ammoniigenes]|uniref:hypothetical protein n=1 Tax=Curtobacterium ammoniigenes TaxID=395387 RepID=UPI00082E71E1|nr:hypothetical protein [Curtobacterium ammoniigenes]
MSKVETKVIKDQRRRTAAAPRVKKARGSKDAIPPQPPVPPGAGRGSAGKNPKQPRQARAQQFQLVGREPRVDLLPTEVHVERRARAIARRAWLGVIVVVVIAGLGVGAATIGAVQSAVKLGLDENQGTSILQQQVQYANVRVLHREVALLQAAQGVGGGEEIDWSTYLTRIAAALPAGVSITNISITSSSPIAAFGQSAAPLDKARVATIDLTVSSSSIPAVPDWTAALGQITGASNLSITSITGGSSSSGPTAYQAHIAFDINADAFDNKYKTKG